MRMISGLVVAAVVVVGAAVAGAMAQRFMSPGGPATGAPPTSEAVTTGPTGTEPGLVSEQAGGGAGGGVEKLVNPMMDPPLPAGSADDMAARMAQRRRQQQMQQAGGGMPAASGTPVNAGGMGGMGGFGGMGGMGGRGVGRGAPVNEKALEQKKLAPVHTGADPSKIEVSDTIITQIIPVKNVDAGRLRADLLPLISADADVTYVGASNCIVVTDTSARVRRLVEIIAELDKEGVVRATMPSGGRGVTGSGMASRSAGRGYQIRGYVEVPKAVMTAPADRIVEKVNVKEGEKVSAGQVLFEFDARAEEAELKVALARLDLAKAQLAQSQADASAVDVAVGKAEMAAQQAQADVYRQRIEMLKLRAPINGVVTTVEVRAGQYLRQGAVLTQVVGTGDIKVKFSLPMDDPAPVKVGQKIVFHVPANGSAGDEGKDYAGEVTYIAPVSNDTNRTDMSAQITGSTANLRSNAMGTVTFVNP